MTSVPAGLANLAAKVERAVSHVALFPLVRRLERQLSKDAPIGGDDAAENERVHFTHPPRFTYPPGEVVHLAFADQEGGLGATLTTTLLGLLGAESPLPELVSENVLQEDDHGALQAFFDVLQHRAVALLYRAWRRYSPVAAFDGGGDPVFAECLQSLVGVDAFSPYAHSVATRAVDPLFALGLSDLSRCEPNFLDPVALEQILGRLFPELAARIVEREPRSVRASNADLTRLGDSYTTLGVDAAYGDDALDTDGVLRIAIGPVSRAIYEELLPGGARYRVLQPLLDEWLASRARVELEILLPTADAPALTLGESFGSALGVDTRQSTSDATLVRVRVLLSPDPSTVTPSYHDDV